jgi:hypothetical protein
VTVTREEIRKEYHLAMAKLAFPNISLSPSFTLPTPEVVYSIYCSQMMVSEAFDIAILFKLDFDRILLAMTEEITSSQSAAGARFAKLDNLLKKYDSGNRLRLQCLGRIIAADLSPPQYFISDLENDSEYLRILLLNGKKDASKQVLKNLCSQSEVGAGKRYLPISLIGWLNQEDIRDAVEGYLDDCRVSA